MRRRLAFAVAAVIVALVVVLVVRDQHDSSRYSVAAVFDTAKGMVAGQQVKIAGAVVGRVERVQLTPQLKARLVLSVDRRFAPFRASASCRILPEGLISENFVACDPGSPDSPPLAVDHGLPTVPLARTAVPTNLQDVLNVFALPTDERIRVLISQLGIATAGRGEDLNAILRRANPALTQTDRLLAIVNGQRSRLQDAVSQTDRVVASLATRDRDVRRFVDGAAATLQTTATNQEALATSVRRLPALLDAARPALRSLDRATTQGTPTLRNLRAAAPALQRVTRDLPPFAAAATRTLRALAPVSDTALRTVRTATPLARHLRATAAGAVPFGDQTRRLLVDTRDRGGIEGILRWVYSLAAASAAYDETSHMAGLMLRVLPQCVLSATAPGCSTKYDAPGQGTIPPDDPSCGPQNGAPWDPPTTCVSQTPTRRRATSLTRRPSNPSRPPATSRLPLPKLPGEATPANRADPVAPTQNAVKQLLDFLLK